MYGAMIQTRRDPATASLATTPVSPLTKTRASGAAPLRAIATVIVRVRRSPCTLAASVVRTQLLRSPEIRQRFCCVESKEIRAPQPALASSSLPGPSGPQPEVGRAASRLMGLLDRYRSIQAMSAGPPKGDSMRLWTESYGPRARMNRTRRTRSVDAYTLVALPLVPRENSSMKPCSD